MGHELDFKDFDAVLADVEKRYYEKGRKYFDSWKRKEINELSYVLCKDFQDLVDEYKSEKIYKRVVDVILVGMMIAMRSKHED